MADKIPKKGPHRMTTACKAETPEQVSDREISAKIRAFAEKADRVIQKAREKMGPEEREQADKNANSILENASAAAKRSQHRA